jgi:hypothetical protein
MTDPDSETSDEDIDNPVSHKPKKFTLESVLGSIPALPNTSPDFEREIEIATEEAMVRKYGWMIRGDEMPRPEDA